MSKSREYVPPGSAAEAAERMFDCDDEIRSIKDQLQQASNERASTGKYQDRDWWRKANYALRAKQSLRQRLQYDLGQLNKIERQRQLLRFERYFISAARKELSSEQFNKIKVAAQARLEEDDVQVEFEGCIGLRETDLALLCEIDGEEVWIPKSVIDDESEVQEEGDEGLLVIPEYIAMEKRLV